MYQSSCEFLLWESQYKKTPHQNQFRNNWVPFFYFWQRLQPKSQNRGCWSMAAILIFHFGLKNFIWTQEHQFWPFHHPCTHFGQSHKLSEIRFFTKTAKWVTEVYNFHINVSQSSEKLYWAQWTSVGAISWELKSFCTISVIYRIHKWSKICIFTHFNPIYTTFRCHSNQCSSGQHHLTNALPLCNEFSLTSINGFSVKIQIVSQLYQILTVLVIFDLFAPVDELENDQTTHRNWNCITTDILNHKKWKSKYIPLPRPPNVVILNHFCNFLTLRT